MTALTILRRSSLSVVMLFGLLLAGCATVDTSDIEVVTRTSPEARFGSYRTYTWLETAQIVNDPFGQWEPPGFDADAAVMAMVDRELGKRGMRATTDSADLLVTFVAGIEMTAYELREGGQSGLPSLQTVPKGALVVVLVDSASNRPVWVGVAGADIQRQPEADAMHQRLDYVVTEMFRTLPVR
jgi:hypothetical protein